MEKLDRGLIAVRKSPGEVFISWRLLGSDPAEMGFNVYQGNKRLNASPIKNSTNYIDSTSLNSSYLIRPVLNGVELSGTKETKVLPANYLEIPLRPGDYYVQHAWPGDLDGNGEYDIVVSRLPRNAGTPVIEAYKLDGTYLWTINMGPNSTTQFPGIGTNDSPPASISGWGNIAGYRDNDNITVYDLDGDGKAEVFVRTAAGVVFGDGKELTSASNIDQYISVIDGMTGKEKARTALPVDYISDGPIGGHFGIAYLDGENPSLVMKLENRKASKAFNLMIAAYNYNGENIGLIWKWLRNGESYANNFHQIRVIDVNGDGFDDICDGSYVIKNDGTFLYGVDGAVHGDRFHVTDMDPDRPGLEGYAIQQAENGNFNQFPWYYYDAATGERIITGANPQDVGRGTVADIDPRFPGYEMWSVEGTYNVKSGLIYAPMPVANFKIWWDGDLLSELLDRTYIDKWNYQRVTPERLLTGANIRNTWRNAPPFYGDILGDWREEVLWEKDDYSALRIYTTDILTNNKLYTLPHNPAYRNCMALKGYYQSNLVDYYLGDGMAAPVQPSIKFHDTACEGSLLLPWQNRDIGIVNFSGCVTQSGNSYKILGSGKDIWDNSDEFYFVYQGLIRDGEISGKVSSVQNTDELAKAGLMIRESAEAGSKYVLFAATSGLGLAFQYRQQTGESSSFLNEPNVKAPCWVKINRDGTVFSCSYSVDGLSWKKFSSVTIEMKNSVLTGMAVTSKSENKLCEGLFEQVNITGKTGGAILHEWWSELPGTTVNDLITSTDYPENPSGRNFLGSLEFPDDDYTDNFGTRIRGFLDPAASGYYTFWIAGSEDAELWLSSDNESDNSSLMATSQGYVLPRQWNKYISQESEPVYLDSGESYYLEILHKAGEGMENLSVAWSGPGIVQEVIKGEYLSPFLFSEDPVDIDEPENINSSFDAVIFPNPAQDLVNLKLRNSGFHEVEFRIYNNTGKLVLVQKINKLETRVDVSMISPGFYFAHINESEKSIVRKFLKL